MSIIAIWGPPNSGKTSLAISLANGISTMGKSCLLISPEAYSELSGQLEIDITDEHSIGTALNSSSSIKYIATPVSDLLFVLAASCTTSAFDAEIDGQKAGELIKQSNALYNYVIVDCPSYIGSAISAWGLNMARHIIMPTGCRNSGLAWYTALKSARLTLDNKTMHIQNEVEPNYCYDELAKALGVIPSIKLPYIKDHSRKTFYGAAGKNGHKYTDAIDILAKSIIEEANKH